MKLLNLGCGNRYNPEWVNVDFTSTGPGVMPCNLYHPLPFAEGIFDAVYHSHLLEHFPKEYAPILLQECFRTLKPNGIIRVVVPDLERIVRLYLEYLEKAIDGDGEARKRYDWLLLELFDQMVRNQPGGNMLNYWKQNPMPAEDFVIERVGAEVLNALDTLRNPANSKVFPTISEDPNFMGELDAKKIAEFRLSGEIHQWMYDRYSLRTLLQNVGFHDINICTADESAIPNFNYYLLDIESNGSMCKPDSLYMEGRK